MAYSISEPHYNGPRAYTVVVTDEDPWTAVAVWSDDPQKATHIAKQFAISADAIEACTIAHLAIWQEGGPTAEQWAVIKDRLSAVVTAAHEEG